MTDRAQNQHDKEQHTQKKGREPDFDVLQIIGNGEHARPMKIGSLWNSSQSDNMVGDTVHGKLVVKPRPSKEDLEALRKNATDSLSVKQTNTLSH